ncbi:MAG TPA: serine/threonine-protein kinase [Micromonospora sp.]
MPDVSPLTAHEPRQAGPYRLLGRLGAGGQGVVYLGQDDRGRQVAVKMINVDLRHNPKAKSQFAREIAAARRVAPFCTAQILFADVDGEPPYVVSEFIAGPTLQRHVREHGPIAGNALYRLAVGTATALTAIHQSDVVHCDLKPDNVILGADGPRVIDFGIARALDVTETVTSKIMGTAPYMAPERFRDEEVGPAADVFAWAATIAFAASGRPPFGTNPMMAVMNRVLHEPPELAGLPADLDDLVRRCLAKEHQARPRAEEILLRLLGPAARPAAPPTPQDLLPLGEEVSTQVTPRAPGLATGQRPEPAAPVRPVRHDSWPRRLARQAGDPWGISAAIFLGSVGGAAGYVGSTATGTAAAVGGLTFVVVYGVRLLVATALTADGEAAGRASDDSATAGRAPGDSATAAAHDQPVPRP